MTIHCSSWCASLSSSLLLFLPFLSPTQQRTSLRFFHTSRKYLCSCEVFVFKPCEMPLPSLLSSFLFFRSLSFSSFFENEICSVLVIATRRLVWTPRRRAGKRNWTERHVLLWNIMEAAVTLLKINAIVQILSETGNWFEVGQHTREPIIVFSRKEIDFERILSDELF